jgi:hypothetical protein
MLELGRSVGFLVELSQTISPVVLDGNRTERDAIFRYELQRTRTTLLRSAGNGSHQVVGATFIERQCCTTLSIRSGSGRITGILIIEVVGRDIGTDCRSSIRLQHTGMHGYGFPGIWKSHINVIDNAGSRKVNGRGVGI